MELIKSIDSVDDSTHWSGPIMTYLIAKADCREFNDHGKIERWRSEKSQNNPAGVRNPCQIYKRVTCEKNLCNLIKK